MMREKGTTDRHSSSRQRRSICSRSYTVNTIPVQSQHVRTALRLSTYSPRYDIPNKHTQKVEVGKGEKEGEMQGMQM